MDGLPGMIIGYLHDYFWPRAQKFEEHIAAFYKSDEFKAKEEAAKPFYKAAVDFLFGRSATLENAVSTA